MRRLENRLRWLEDLLDTEHLLKGISLARLQNFADEARSLETYDLRDIGQERRHTLLICLIHQAKIQNRDHLVEIFLKRIRRVHKKAKDELDAIREQQRQLAERLIEMMMGIANAAQQDITDEALGQIVRQSFEEEGGSEIVFNTCQSLVAYHNDNTLPLLWGQYASHSRTVLQSIEQLDLKSTSQDDSLQQALDVLKQHQGDEFLPLDTSLDFASQRWRQSIRIKQDGNRYLSRSQFEICVMTRLAHELLAGDWLSKALKIMQITENNYSVGKNARLYCPITVLN